MCMGKINQEILYMYVCMYGCGMHSDEDGVCRKMKGMGERGSGNDDDKEEKKNECGVLM